MIETISPLACSRPEKASPFSLPNYHLLSPRQDEELRNSPAHMEQLLAPLFRETPGSSTELVGPLINRVRDLSTMVEAHHGAVSSIPYLLKLIHHGCSAAWARIIEIAHSIFGKKAQTVVVQEILEDLCFLGALSLHQKGRIESLLSRNLDSAYIELTGFLNIALDEVSDHLMAAKRQQSDAPIAVLSIAYLSKRIAKCPHITKLLTANDGDQLASISLSGSAKELFASARFLQEISDRITLYTWIQNFDRLLQIPKDEGCQRAQKALQVKDFFTFKKEVIQLLRPLNSPGITNESCYSKELISALEGSLSLRELSREVLSQQWLSSTYSSLRGYQKTARVWANTQKALEPLSEELNRFQETLHNEKVFEALEFARPRICTTFGASQIGALRRTQRKISSLFSLARPPKEVLFLYCTCGGGHRSMTTSLIKSLEAQKRRLSHEISTSSIDVPIKATRPVDSVYRTLRYFGEYDTTWLYNFLLSTDRCWLIEKLKSMGGKPSEEQEQKKQALIRQALLAFGPDLLNLTYTFDGNDIAAVSEQLGIPLLHVATDLDLSGWDHRPTAPFFTSAVPTLQDPTMQARLSLDRDQVREIGLTIVPEAENEPSLEDLEKLRNSYRSQYGMKPQEQMVVMSHGKAGLQSNLPELLAQTYTNTNTPICLIIACGTNLKYKSYIESSIIPRIATPQAIRMIALGTQNQEKMIELMRVCDRFIGKPGGMTCMELWKTRASHRDPGIIFDMTSYRFSWEAYNAKVLVHRGLATLLEKSQDIVPLLQEPTSHHNPDDTVAQIPASQRYTALVDELLMRASKDKELKKIKKNWYNMVARFGTVDS